MDTVLSLLLILSSASQRTDHTALLPANLKKPAAEIADRWRKDQANAFALSILATGLAVSAAPSILTCRSEQFRPLTRRCGRDLNKWCSINDR